MLNRYSLWKYIILIIIVFTGLLYALPSLYGECPSIHIASTDNTLINEQTLIKIQKILKEKNIVFKSIFLKEDVILIHFFSNEKQLSAFKILNNIFKNKYTVTISFSPLTPNWLTLLNAEPIKLGLDLRGGIYFLIKVDVETIFCKLQDQNIKDLYDELYTNHIPCLNIIKNNCYEIRILFKDSKTRDKAIKYLINHRHDFFVSNQCDNKIKAIITHDRLKEIRKFIVQQNINILRNRVNQLGITEPIVQSQGDNFIIVELPGIQDIAQAKKILGATATIEFRLVNDNINQYSATLGNIPVDSEIKQINKGQQIVLYKHAILTGNHIINSTLSQDEYNHPQVNIFLDNIGGKIMSNFTKNNIGKYIATLFIEYKDSGKKNAMGYPIMVKKEQVINIANIHSRLSNKFRITGINNLNEARQLSLLLRSGPLMAPIQIIKECTIGPTLGTENMKKGLKASLAGIIISIIFIIISYKIFGLIATTALIVNLVLIVAIMSLLPGATLTMPGIAGIVLTLSVAIDANVLINERIKEELKNGRSVQYAIYEGYRGAFNSIFDANITTLIKVIILYVIGTGAIKGFAITTGIGIITSMFTAIIGTRAIVNLLYGNKKVKRLSI